MKSRMQQAYERERERESLREMASRNLNLPNNVGDMTYGQLLEQLHELSPQQLNQSVTVYIPDDEYIPVRSICVVDLGQDVLDEDQIVLNTEGE